MQPNKPNIVGTQPNHLIDQRKWWSDDWGDIKHVSIL